MSKDIKKSVKAGIDRLGRGAKNLKNKCLEHRKAVLTAVILIAVVIIIIAVVSSAKHSNSQAESTWRGSPLTESIPEFAQNADSIKITKTSAAAFYSEVSSSDIAQYVERLRDDCGVDLSGEGFPRSAVYGDRVIALHYNYTDRKFSVTVAIHTGDDN